MATDAMLQGSRACDAVRRALDIVLASLALVISVPVMLVIALAIWTESGLPILFSQIRLGQHRRPFLMYKFRKFHQRCGTTGPPLCLVGDARLTFVGRILRRTKLDELPQFWNVVKGDMSIVGPRPETLVFSDCFVDGLERVLDYKPGIIGPSQVLFRSESAYYPADGDPRVFYRAVLFPTKARIDLAYYKQRTVLSDLEWMFRGALAILGWATPNLGPGFENSTELLSTSADIPESKGPPRGQSRRNEP